MMMGQFQKDERDAIASGIPESKLMDHFFQARIPPAILWVGVTDGG